MTFMPKVGCKQLILSKSSIFEACRMAVLTNQLEDWIDTDNEIAQINSILDFIKHTVEGIQLFAVVQFKFISKGLDIT